MFEKIKQLDWRKTVKTVGAAGILIAGNAVGFEILRQSFDQSAKANARIGVLEQHLMDIDFGLCLSLRQNMPSSFEEDQMFCGDWVRERAVKYGIMPERNQKSQDQAD